MAEAPTPTPFLDMDTTFLKTKRGMLKVGQMVTFFVAFVCFTAVLHLKYSVAAALEFLMSVFMLLWYLFKLNKTLTFFFWPLVDFFNTVFASLYFGILTALTLSSYTVIGALVGAIFGLVAVGLLCADAHLLFKSITFNQRSPEPSAAPGVNSEEQ